MVSISDIPCVGKAVDRISDATVDAGFRGLGYLLCYNSVIHNLTSELDDLKIQEDRVSRKAVADKADGKTIEEHVIRWQRDVHETKMRADELSKQRPSWNPLTRFQMGRKAAHEAKNVADLTRSGSELLLNEIAYLPADANIPLTDTTYQPFNSREEAYQKLREALVKEDGHPVIAIYGMPGVGKTRMMEQAWREAKDKNVFNKVTRANVGQGIDVKSLQKQLAGFLDCHLQDNEVRWASQLKNSLINAGKTLIILDDVWDVIPLETIGIPLVKEILKGSKILLTSRRKDICLRNSCKDPIKIESLKVDEAWDMFTNTVGILNIDSLTDKELARKVCKECAGLPLLIQALGNTLKFASEDSWKDALYQLENSNLEEIDGIESQVYTCIKLSFDKLPEAEKTCLLLCSLYPEDAEIQIKMLEDIATGSQLLNRGRNVRGLVDNLKLTCLLLEGKTHRTVKLHDVIRDVAASVAARDEQYAFLLIRGGLRLPNNVNYRTWRLLQVVDSDDFQCPTDMVCPNLHTLWLEANNKPQQFSESFFKGIDNLKILMLKGRHAFPKQISIQYFDKLTCLILEGCELNETSLSVIPESLEIISISRCHIQNPLDLSKLKSLRKLKVVSRYEIEMVENAKSTLPATLEEVHIPGGFRIIDAESKISKPIAPELNKLTGLRSLNIRLESCPNENVVANLHDFIIDVGNGWDRNDEFMRAVELQYMRSVMFNKTCIVSGGGELLVDRAEEVIFNDVEGSADVFSNSKRQAFPNLKTMYIKSCEDMEHLVPLTSFTYFSNLTHLYICKCSGLKDLFSASVAKSLVQLEELYIEDCPRLEEVVIRNETVIDDDGVIITFPKLKTLTLLYLQSLRRFCGEKRSSTTIAAGSHCLFDGMIVFPSIQELTIGDVNTSELWGENCCSNNSFNGLKTLVIVRCHNLVFAIPLTMLTMFQNLEKLAIGDCESMRSDVESSNPELPPLVALRSIFLYKLSALTQTRLNSWGRNLYPNLETLQIRKCKSLRNVFLPSIAKHLLYLKKLIIKNCEMMSEIIGDEEEKGEMINEFVFPELTSLKLKSLPNFKSFCFNESVEAPQHQFHLVSKVSFPKLAVLEFNLKTVDKVQLPSKWKLQFPKMKELTLKNCWHGNFCRCIEGGGEFLVDGADEVILEDIKGSPQGFSNSNREAFSNMRKLSIESCEGMEHVACIPYYEIQLIQPVTSFSTLTSLEINKCLELKYLFPASVAKCLVELQQLHIENCPTLNVVIRNESYVHGVILLPKLRSLMLWNLESLESFYGVNRGRSSSSTTIMENAAVSPSGSESPLDGMVSFPNIEILKCNVKGSPYCLSNSNVDAFPNLEKLFIKSSEDIEHLACRPQYEIQQSQLLTPFSKLSILFIHKCSGLKYLFCASIVKCLMQLQVLWIIDCPTLEVVIRNESAIDGVIINFPKLKELRLYCLPSLRSFYSENRGTSSTSTTIMQNAGILSDASESLFDAECLTYSESCGVCALFSCSVFMNLHQLRKLIVKHCPLLEEVVREEDNVVVTSDNTISLLKLEAIEFKNLSKLKSFSRSASYAFNLPNLKSIVLRNCPQMEKFTCLETRTQSMPDFNSQIEKYLSNPNKDCEEDNSDADSEKEGTFNFDSFMEEKFDDYIWMG